MLKMIWLQMSKVVIACMEIDVFELSTPHKTWYLVDDSHMMYAMVLLMNSKKLMGGFEQ